MVFSLGPSGGNRKKGTEELWPENYLRTDGILGREAGKRVSRESPKTKGLGKNLNQPAARIISNQKKGENKIVFCTK